MGNALALDCTVADGVWDAGARAALSGHKCLKENGEEYLWDWSPPRMQLEIEIFEPLRVRTSGNNFGAKIYSKRMAKTLIETPFPTTAEVARMIGVSPSRVRELERMVFGDSESRHSDSRKAGAKAGKARSAGRRKRAEPRS